MDSRFAAEPDQTREKDCLLYTSVLQVQHLVVENVFDGVARYARVIEDAADDDSVMSRVVVAETAPGVVLAPGELRTTHESVEEATVEVFEDFF